MARGNGTHSQGSGNPYHSPSRRSGDPTQPNSWYRDAFIAGAAVLLSNALFWLIRGYLGKGHAALLYLPVVVLAASLGGTRAGFFTALLSFFSWNFFFLPPYYTFIISDPKDWISLFVFLVVGLTLGWQTGRMREREADALAREEEASLLYRLSSHLTAQTEVSALASTLLEEVAHAVGTEEAALFLLNPEQRLHAVPTFGLTADKLQNEVTPLARWSFDRVKALGLPEATPTERGETRWPIVARLPDAASSIRDENVTLDSANPLDIYLPLQADTHSEGVLYVGGRGNGVPYGLRDSRLLVSISHLAAAFLERQRLQTRASQAEALQEADRLKSTLISSVSHELKTPLASVTATISNLLESDVEWEPEVLKQELQSVDHSLMRLNDSIGDLLDLSRLEAGAWEPKRDWQELGDILGTVLSKIPVRDRDRIQFELPDDLPPLSVDFNQWARALQNLIENALLYSPPDQPVTVGASAGSGEIQIWVSDAGPGVGKEEREKIFQKFYRGQAASAVPSGTGLGLAITWEIVRFHGGHIKVEEGKPHGARFVIALPNPTTEEGGHVRTG